jgi:hypothetical protein
MNSLAMPTPTGLEVTPSGATALGAVRRFQAVSHGGARGSSGDSLCFVAGFDDCILHIDFEQAWVLVDGHSVDLVPAVYKASTGS